MRCILNRNRTSDTVFMNRNYSFQEHSNSYSWNTTLFPNCPAASSVTLTRDGVLPASKPVQILKFLSAEIGRREGTYLVRLTLHGVGDSHPPDFGAIHRDSTPRTGGRCAAAGIPKDLRCER